MFFHGKQKPQIPGYQHQFPSNVFLTYHYQLLLCQVPWFKKNKLYPLFSALIYLFIDMIPVSAPGELKRHYLSQYHAGLLPWKKLIEHFQMGVISCFIQQAHNDFLFLGPLLHPGWCSGSRHEIGRGVT